MKRKVKAILSFGVIPFLLGLTVSSNYTETKEVVIEPERIIRDIFDLIKKKQKSPQPQTQEPLDTGKGERYKTSTPTKPSIPPPAKRVTLVPLWAHDNIGRPGNLSSKDPSHDATAPKWALEVRAL